MSSMSKTPWIDFAQAKIFSCFRYLQTIAHSPSSLVQFKSNDCSDSLCDKSDNSRSWPQISSTEKSGFSKTARLMQ